MRGLRFIPDSSKVDFIRFRFLAVFISFAMAIASIGLVAVNGLNFGIDFTGGTLIEIRTPQKPDLEAMRKTLNELEFGAISIQEFGQDDDLLIRIPDQLGRAAKQGVDEAELNKAAIDTVKASLGKMYEGKEVDYRRIEFVGPQVGEELKIRGLWAILLSVLGISVYIWFRFEWKYGVAAIISLAHDSIAIIGLFALIQMEFNLSTVAAVLLVAGYSINDTVVVFDRIREDLRKYKKKPIGELLNMSINETLSRTILTSFTTLIALFALYLFGGEVIRGFVYALIFGIAFGTYSSIFVAAPLLMWMNIRGQPKKDGAPDDAADQDIVIEAS